jgi:hypothetical protein
MALSQEVAQQLADAYGAGDIDTVNNLLSGGVNAEDVQKFWNFDEAAMADLLGKGVSFAEPSKADKAVVEDRAPAGIASLPSNLSKAPTSSAQQYLDANPDVNAEFELFKKQEPAKWTPESYAAYHYGNYGKDENRAGTEGLTGNINTLANQILGQNLTSKWTGEGFGSAEANARDMANILTGIGIKDIKDFGKITKEVPVTNYDESGNPYNTGQTEKITTYGNLKTGQEVPNTYSERQTGNTFGGTYTGKGNTGYRVQFAPDGTPIFYTTGASSNDLVNMFADNPILGAVAQVGAAYLGGPLGSAALNAAMGKDVGDIAKSAVLSYLGNQAFQGLTDVGVDTNAFGETGANFAKDIKDALGDTGSKILGKTASQFVANEGKVDIGSLLVNQGIGAATSAVLDQIPDFKTLDPTIQKLVTKTVSNTLSGGPNLTPAQLVSTALTEGLKASKGGGNLTSEEQAQIEANRETKRLNRIEDAVLNQPASDDGTTQGILDLINEMYPADNIKGMSQGDLSKFLEANMDEIQGSAELETLLKGAGEKTTDNGTVNVTGKREDGTDVNTPVTKSIGDQGNIVVTGDRPTKSVVTSPDNPDEVVITDKRDEPYVPSIRTKEITSSITDTLTPDDITKLFPDLKVDDILQLLTPTVTKVTPPGTKTPTKTTTATKKVDPLLEILGLESGQATPSQDPYAHIKSMEELFGGDIAYKLRSLGMPANLASADIDALTRLLRNKNG